MGLEYTRLFGTNENTSELAAKPDMSGFKAQSMGLGLGGSSLANLGQIVSRQIGPAHIPAQVPWSDIEAMGLDPVIYLGEAAATAPVRDPRLYYCSHADPKVKAETEQWLYPLLPALTTACARSYAWGSVPFVLDWEFADLVTQVRREGSRPRKRKIPGHYHFSGVHILHPGRVQIEVGEDGNMVGLTYAGETYGTDRAFLAVWDPQWEGEFTGFGSRRRAYWAWYAGLSVEQQEARYLERSVDSPRIGTAPPGLVKVGGQEVQATQVLTSALLGLRNGGACVLPSSREDGQPLWSIESLDLPDRSGVWESALNRLDAKKLLASLVPPSSVGLQDATFAGARIPSQLFVEFVQQIATYTAATITRVVAAVHAVNHGDGIPAPIIKAYEIPAAKKKILLEVFRMVAALPRTLEDGRTITMGDMVSDEIMDQLGIPRREPSAASATTVAPPAGGGGGSRDTSSEREERRGAAREPEGEDDTGQDRDPAAGA